MIQNETQWMFMGYFYIFCNWFVPIILFCGSILMFHRQKCVSSMLLLVGSSIVLFWMCSLGDMWPFVWLRITIGDMLYDNIKGYAGGGEAVVFSIGFLLHGLAPKQRTREGM
jgi:hypothetical protein